MPFSKIKPFGFRLFAFLVAGLTSSAQAARYTALPEGKTQIVVVNSPDRDGATNWWARKGQKLRITVDGNQVWYDWFVKTNPAGYSLSLEPLFNLMRRVPDAKYFQVIACVDDRRWLNRSDYFVVPLDQSKSQPVFTANRTGRLEIFANDIDFMYWNNSGAVKVRVTRLR